MNTFSEWGLPKTLLNCLERLNFTTPTPIQAAAIPVALKGRDILGSAQTGTGKTAAFGIPLIERLMTTEQTTALIMTPTRELAAQVMKALRDMLPADAEIRTALLIGGESIQKQLSQLRGYPRLVVGTPGRINDHLERKSLKLRDAGYLVLDETDRMLDMGFGPQIDRILRHMPKERQTLLFSATLPPTIVSISRKYLHMPERISVGANNAAVENINQEVIKVRQPEKYGLLKENLDARKGSIIVFVKTKRGAERMAIKLTREGYSAAAIHGDLRQRQRDNVIADFRDKKYRVLIATDVAARGLDIPHIEHVINFDLPQVAEDYIHRIGRTARAGKKGDAVCFLSPEDGAKWKEIYHLMNPSEKELRNDDRALDGLMAKKSGPKKSSAGGFRGDKSKPRSGAAGRSYRGEEPRRRSEDGEKRFSNNRSGDRPFAKKKSDGKPTGKPTHKPKGRVAARDATVTPLGDQPRSRPAGKPQRKFGAKPAGKTGGKSGKPPGSKQGKFARKNARRRQG